MRFFPSKFNLKTQFLKVNSHHFGILESQILTTTIGKRTPNTEVCTSNMPAYHKKIINTNSDINYHLAGYGTSFEESMIRLLGEGIERYGLLVASQLYEEYNFFGSYNEVAKKGKVVPFEFLNIHSSSDVTEMQKTNRIKSITKKTPLTWTKCSSLFNAGEYIYVPTQMLFLGFAEQDTSGVIFAPCFSKGTAAHTNLVKALNSAIMESVEADAFMISWYTERKVRKIIIDDEILLNVVGDIYQNLESELLLLDYSIPDQPGYTVAAVLISDERPCIVMGVQSSLDVKKAIYKAVLEASAVFYLASNGPLMLPEDYLYVGSNTVHNNLDSNVAYWASEDEIIEKKKYFKRTTEGEIPVSAMQSFEGENENEDAKFLLKKVKGISEYAVYFDVTPPELSDSNWKVMRVFIPELVQMGLPSFPYRNHPRLQQMGGATNVLPHPIP